jgi:tetratricopeptide (TPR) repeat protein
MLEFLYGHVDQAIRTLTTGAELCQSAGYAEERRHASHYLAMIYTWRGDYERVFVHQEDLIGTREKDFDLRSYVRGLSSCTSQAYAHLGRWDEAVELGRKALSAAQDYSDNSLIATAASMLSAVYTYKGDLDQAIQYGELGLAKAPTPMDKIVAQVFLAWSLCHTGEPHRGVALLAGIIPALKAARVLVLELWCTLFLAEGYWLAGEYDKGRETAGELLKIADLFGARFCTGYACYLLGGISLEANPAEAASHFEKGIAMFQDIKAENLLARSYAGYGRLHRKLGNPSQARDYLRRALSIFERLGTLTEPDKVRKELAELPEGG